MSRGDSRKPMSRSRLFEKIAVAIFITGLTTLAQAEHCVQGTLCYPDPGEACGPTGPLYCPGDDGSTVNYLPQISIPHRADNPYIVNCGVSDEAQMIRSLSFDVLAYQRDNGYKDYFDIGLYKVPVGDIQYTAQYSDGSITDMIGGGLFPPGVWNASLLQNPISDYSFVSIGQYVNVPLATMYLGADSSGYVFATQAMGIVYDPAVRPSLCQPSVAP